MGVPVSLINNLNFDCNGCFSVKKKLKTKAVMESLYRVSQKYKLSILPISSEYELENLYPITDRVHEWNTMIVGNDKTYILSHVGDNKLEVPKNDLEDIVNTNGSKLPEELFLFFDSVWDYTLQGTQLQFYIVLNGKLYLINTYCLRNKSNKVIGGTLFMRNFDTLPPSYSRMTSRDIGKAKGGILQYTNASLSNTPNV